MRNRLMHSHLGRSIKDGRQPLRSGCIRGPQAAASRGSRFSFGGATDAGLILCDLASLRLCVSFFIAKTPRRRGAKRICEASDGRYSESIAVGREGPKIFEDM